MTCNFKTVKTFGFHKESFCVFHGTININKEPVFKSVTCFMLKKDKVDKAQQFMNTKKKSSPQKSTDLKSQCKKLLLREDPAACGCTLFSTFE